jgi:hypothetical protein
VFRLDAFGGHPNPHATFSTMAIAKANPADASFQAFAMVTDPRVIQHAMKSTAHLKLPQLGEVGRDFYDAAPPILNCGNLTTLEAIRRAWSFVSKFAEVRRPGSSS